MPAHQVLVTTAMRTASTTLIDLTNAVIGSSKRGPINFSGPRHVASVEKIMKEINYSLKNRPGCAMKSHSLPPAHPRTRSLLRKMPELRIISSSRELGDVIISRALYCRNTRVAEGHNNLPAIQEIIDKYPDLSDQQFVNHFIRECSMMNELCMEWAMFDLPAHHPAVLQLRFNDIAFSMEDSADRIAQHVGLRLPYRKIVAICERMSFKRRQKEIPAHQFMRAGTSGQWKEMLDDGAQEIIISQAAASRRAARLQFEGLREKSRKNACKGVTNEEPCPTKTATQPSPTQ